jgi:hypothetical protein
MFGIFMQRRKTMYKFVFLLAALCLSAQAQDLAGAADEPQSISDEEQFLIDLETQGIPFTSSQAREQAQAYRVNGLFSDLLLENIYPDFWAAETAIRAARAAGGGKVFISKTTSNYAVWPQTLNARDLTMVEIEFELGYQASVQFPPELASCPVVDMAGSNRCQLKNVRLVLDGNSTRPGCGVFIGRAEPLGGGNWNVLSEFDIVGPYGDDSPYGGACIVNIGCEIFHLTDNGNARFWGKKGGAFFTSSYNNHRITSPYGSIAGGFTPGAGGAISNAGGVIDGACHFACDTLPEGANPNDRYVIKLGSRTHSVWIHDIYLTAKTAGSLGASFVLGDTTDNEVLYGGTSNIVISNLHDEAYASPFFVRLDGKTRGVIVKDIANIQAGMVLGYGDVYGSVWANGIQLENLLHRPHPNYWTGAPMPVAAP